MNPYNSEFTRWIWNSARAREVWEPRIREINRVWGVVEILSVASGARNAALLFPTVEELPLATRRAAEQGLLLLPIVLEGNSPTAYSSSAQEYKPGNPGRYRAVLVRPECAGAALDAWGKNDERSIGQLLGYPQCCSEFFQKVWVEGQRVDTTLAMAETTGGDTAGPPESNIMLRWLSVRLVPHLPCSFSCIDTVEFAHRLEAVWRSVDGGERALTWALDMLSWPMEWTALHGIAEIRTPILTISARTDWTPTKAVVPKVGTTYPDEGAVGLRFPYRVVKDKLTKAPSFQRSVLPVWELNGFSSMLAMEQAHAVLLSVLPPHGGTLLDLGCGSGRLLELAKEAGWRVEGVESDPIRAGAGQIPIRRGDMFDAALWNKQYDVVALMPGRLIEVGKERAEQFRHALKQRAHSVLAYAYGDWLERFGGLGPLLSEVGLGNADVVNGKLGNGVEAALLALGGNHDN